MKLVVKEGEAREKVGAAAGATEETASEPDAS